VVTGSEVLASGADVLLADGRTATIRPIRATDRDGVAALYARQSAQTLYFRYFGPHRPTEEEIDKLIEADGVDHVVLIAEQGSAVIGIAQYDRTVEADEAEVAFLVDDHFQGLGIGTLLLEQLAAIARDKGIRRFSADTMSENHKMIAVFRDAGFSRRFGPPSETVHVIMDISPSPEAVAAADARDRVAMVRSVERLMRPRSIAVIGASRKPGSVGNVLLRNLVDGGFCGPVYPVNPSCDHVASIPCWPSVKAIPGVVDLAVIATPARTVAGIVEECGRSGVGGLVVVSAGFAETGSKGAEVERAITHLAHHYGMRMVGPNCFGLINTDPAVSMNATFAATVPRPGNIGFASQSGGLGIAILGELAAREIGISSFVSMGNKADVSGNDLLTWWAQDDRTDVVLLYLESFGNPRKFARVARRVSRSKPVVAVKGGRSSAGTRAAHSHTAALATPDATVDALFQHTGVIRVETIEELFDVGELLGSQPAPAGPRVAVIGNAGGPGVLAADALASHGFELPELSSSTQQALQRAAPEGAAFANPVDLVASATPATYREALGVLLSSKEVDAVLVIFTPPLQTDAEAVARAIVAAADTAAADRNTQTVVAAFLGAEDARRALASGSRPIPCFTYPENAARALAHARRYAQWRSREDGTIPVLDAIDPRRARQLIATAAEQHPKDGRDHSFWLTGPDAMAILAAYGITTLPTRLVRSASEASAEAEALGFPVALKGSGPTLLHKSDVGGVRLGLRSGQEVASAFNDLAAQLGEAMEGAVVQPMAQPGVETIAGVIQDATFGPLVVFGLGGTAVELLGDRVLRLAPLTDLDAREMVLGLRGTPLLTGYRGNKPVDLDALVDVLARLSRIAEDLPEVAELDCNPIVALPQGATVVDARLRISLLQPEYLRERRQLR